MKIAIAALLVGSAAAFAPISQPAFRVTALNANGKAAKSPEEDLELTREVILGFIGGDDDAAAAEEPKKEKKAKKSKKAKKEE